MTNKDWKQSDFYKEKSKERLSEIASKKVMTSTVGALSTMALWAWAIFPVSSVDALLHTYTCLTKSPGTSFKTFPMDNSSLKAGIITSIICDFEWVITFIYFNLEMMSSWYPMRSNIYSFLFCISRSINAQNCQF